MANSDVEIFQLDENRLDEHWLDQAKLMHEHSIRLADARDEHERRKRKRDVVLAEVDLDVRRNPAGYGLEKVTEKAVENSVILEARVQRAEERVLAAKHKVELLQALVHALDDRKKTLENLVSLWSQAYFGEPKAPKVAKEKVEEMVKRDARSKGRRS